MKTISERDKISLSECKRILNKNGNHYTDDEIIEIRNWLYFISEITLTALEDNEEPKTVIINIQNHETESNFVHPRKYGRTK